MEKESSISLRIENRITTDNKIRGVYIDLDVYESHRYAVIELKDLIAKIIQQYGEKARIESEERLTTNQIGSLIVIKFQKKSKLFAELKNHFRKAKEYSDYLVTEIIREGELDVKRSFLRGYADVASLISRGARVFGTGKFRIYINVYGQNKKLFDGLVGLLNSINIPAYRHDRHNTALFDAREMQIRVYPEDFKLIGYNVAWKKRLLYDFIRANTTNNDDVTENIDLK